MNRTISSRSRSKTRAICGAVLTAVTVASLTVLGCASDDEDELDNDDGAGWSRNNPIILVGNTGNWTPSLTANRQEAWFRFEANGRYKITFRDSYYRPTGAGQQSYTVDARIAVTDADGEYIPSAYSNDLINGRDWGGNDDNEFFLTDLEGTYYIRITPYSSGSTGTFYLGITREGGVTAGEDADNAIRITSTRYTQNELTTSRPERWFYFTATSSSETLNVFDSYYNPTNATVTKPTVDVRVSVMDDYFDFLPRPGSSSYHIDDWDIGSNSDGVLNLTDLTPGAEYFVKISQYSNNGYGTFYIWLD